MWIQLMVDGSFTGLAWCLVAAGLVLVHRSTGQLNLLLGGVLAVGAYLGSWVGGFAGGAAAVVVAIFIGVGCGVVGELLLFRPLRLRGAPPVAVLLAAFAAYLMVEALLALAIGAGRRPAALEFSDVVAIGPVAFNQIRFYTALLAIFLITAVHWFFVATVLGLRLRAMAADSLLAEVRGLPVEFLSLVAHGLSGAFASTAGLLLALDVGVAPDMGLMPTVYGLAVMVLAAQGGEWSILIAGLLLGCARSLSIIWLPGIWADAVVFTALFLLLGVRSGALHGRWFERT